MSNYKRNVKIGEFDFLQFPRVVWNDKNLSSMAKLLYMAFFDRMKVSYKNCWFDEDLNVYIYYTLEDICESLQIGEKKAQALKKELRDKGLITEVRQGLNRPNKIFVQRFEDVYSNQELIGLLSE